MRHLISTLALVAIATAPAAAQEMEHKEGMEHHGTGVAAVAKQYEQVKGWIIRSAEMMPEENYSFRPTEDVRSFGELIGHLANAGYFFCSTVLDEDSPNAVNIEETVSGKAELVEALKTGFAYCDKAYAIAEMKAMGDVTFFGQEGSRLWVMIFNVTHDFEHYGNLVTYLRMNGITPPSSQRG
jgi:uncharacterized damage-inducible protein DinB